MAKAGDVIVNGEERILFRQTAAETNGELLEVEVTYKPHSKRPPEHYHPRQEERFELLSGILAAKIGDQEFRFEPGDQSVVPPGTPHWMHNISDEPARLLWQTRPALKTGSLFKTIWSLTRDGKIGPNGPNLLQAAVIGQAYSQEFRVTKPPYWVQKVVFFLLAPIGRLAGYRADYS
jgi:quercetin dioxygenase-like cupin family protein